MISDREFASGYPSFWSVLLPMGGRFPKLVGLERIQFAGRIDSKTAPWRRDVINEAGFRLACDALNGDAARRRFDDQFIAAAFSNAVQAIRRFSTSQRPSRSQALQQDERSEIGLIAQRLVDRFGYHARRRQLTCSPQFEGCGLIDPCEGDIIAGNTLWEVKAGDREFQVQDLRQILTYCAVNHASLKYSINRVGFINPRRGVYLSGSVEQLCRAVGGVGSSELLTEIVEFISQPQMPDWGY